jgi:hypothetical protein
LPVLLSVALENAAEKLGGYAPVEGFPYDVCRAQKIVHFIQ